MPPRNNSSLEFLMKLRLHDWVVAKSWHFGSPNHRERPESTFSGKERFGALKPPFPLVLETEACFQRNPLFSAREHMEMGFLTQSSLFQPM